MKISYLVCCHNEGRLLNGLIIQLANALDGNEDEIVMLDDFSTDAYTKSLLQDATKLPRTRVVQHALNGDFGTHKTFGSRQCAGDFIAQLDADERLSQPMMDNIHAVLEANPTIDLYRLPRVNIVHGATVDDARRWGWHLSTLPEYGDAPIINWNGGDYQSRIYRNDENIVWYKKLHETVGGAKIATMLPKEVDYAIIHEKTIDRQRAQNEFYNKNWSPDANMGRG